jgi:phytoene dehydrogenase-like protein
MSDRDYDAVVIGAGINGLVAAAELAGAGRRVALVDEHDRLGGFIVSQELTAPGFVHDTFSSWHPQFVAGPAYAELGEDLHRHGLRYANTEGPLTAAVSHRGAVIAHRDPAATAAELAGPDGEAYLALLGDLERWSPLVFGALGSDLTPVPIVRLFASAARRVGRRSVGELARTALQSGRALARERFAGWEADQLWVPWLLHAGLSPDHAGGALMLAVMAGSLHQAGLPVVAGGAAGFTNAFAGLLAERGVELMLGRAVTRIDVVQGRVTGVVAGGERLRARTVLASTSTQRLHGELLPRGAGGQRAATALARQRAGRGALQIHLALDAPVPWADARLGSIPLVHLGDGSGSTGIACAQAEAGLLPAAPTVAVGQQCLLDPSRAPDGAATLWLQLQEAPYRPVGDAAGRITVDGRWTPSVLDAYGDRVLARLETFAPGVRDHVVGRHCLSPADLERANPNAVAGDPYGGAAELDRSLIWRPGAGSGHNTGIKGLFHIGAFTHPGPGLGGVSGHVVAQRLITDPIRLRDRSRLAERSRP